MMELEVERDLLVLQETRENLGLEGQMVEMEGEVDQANLAVKELLDQEDILGPKDLLVKWDSKVLRDNLGHLGNRGLEEQWDLR